MRFLLIGDEATREDLETAMLNLRAKRREVRVEQFRAEIDEDIDELIDLWAAWQQ